MAHLQHTDKPIYDNWVMESPDGTVMCRCSKDRADWYLERDLAEVKPGNTIRLTFTPKGLGNVGSEFYTAFKLNQCVACGAEDRLTKHHVVPRMYRQFFPVKMKANRSIDVLILCVDCHVAYEDHSQARSREILEKFQVREWSEMIPLDLKNLGRAKSFAWALVKKSALIPVERQEEMKSRISNWIGKPISAIDLVELTRIPIEYETYVTHPGQQVVEKLTDLDKFIIEWRQHFVDVMSPKHLPPGWEVSVLV